MIYPFVPRESYGRRSRPLLIFPAYGLYVDRADNVRLENVRFRLSDGTKDFRPEFAGIK